MKKINQYLATAVFLLCAMAAHAQMITAMPTNYSLSITAENNFGKMGNNVWQANFRDTTTLSQRTLVFTHTVFFDVPYFGTRGGGPKMLEDSYTYRQIGGAAYVPVGGQNITYFTPKRAGGWIAQTNLVSAADMNSVFWLPTLVGNVTLSDGLTRTVTKASPLELSCRNLSTTPHLLRINCGSLSGDFYQLFRFEGNERKMLTLGVGNGSVGYVTFDLDEITAEALTN